MARKSEISQFYTDVFVTNARNQLSTRCRFLVSWTLSDTSYNPATAASMYAGRSYAKVRDVILMLMTQFRRYVESIEVPDLAIDGSAVDDGMGAAFLQDNDMLHPSSSRLTVNFLETQVSVSDMVNVWMEMNARPFVKPIRLNLNMDHVSDRDGRTVVMSYQATGCRPVNLQMLKCNHDGRTVAVRSVTFGFDAIRPITTDGSKASDKDSAVMKNWNAMMDSYEKAMRAAGAEAARG